MPYDGYVYGSPRLVDKMGYPTDIAENLAERFAMSGRAWRLSIPRTTLSADGIYATLSFTTPADDNSYYQFASTSKTGAEVGITLIEGGTYAGGTNVTGETAPWRYNRILGDTGCPFTSIQTGVSPTATITGGRVAPTYILPGTSQGNNSAPTTGESAAFALLKPNTNYVLKMTAIGGAATVSAIATVATDKLY